ncbi:MAG TPA: hypothetical protein VLA79_07430 [Polyangia bacterium]|nr:hypothetical protein [Polyangia bacterium]
MSENRRRRTAAALATSAGLHLLVALLVLRGVAGGRPAEPAVERTPPPIELSVIETKRRDRSPESRAEVSAPPSRRRAPDRRPIASGGTASPPATPPAPASRPSEGPSERPVDLSFDALGDRAKQRATATPGRDEALEALLVPTPERPTLPARRRPVDELRAEADRRADAVANVRAGRAHPLLFDLLRNARDRMTPEATRIAESLPLGVAETTKGWARGYLKGVADAHSGQLAPPPGPEETTGGPRPDVLGGYNEAAHQAESGAEQRSAEICLGVAPNHAVVATLRRSSGNAALDRLAVESFKLAGETRPVTPDVRPALACYRVAVSAFRMPPLPSVGIDLANGRIIYPLKRITKVTVELQSVDFGAARKAPSFLDVRSR